MLLPLWCMVLVGLLFRYELYNCSQSGVEFSFNNFSLNFVRKDQLAIRKFLLNFYAGHKHVRIFRSAGTSSQLRLCVSLKKYDSTGL